MSDFARHADALVRMRDMIDQQASRLAAIASQIGTSPSEIKTAGPTDSASLPELPPTYIDTYIVLTNYLENSIRDLDNVLARFEARVFDDAPPPATGHKF